MFLFVLALTIPDYFHSNFDTLCAQREIREGVQVLTLNNHSKKKAFLLFGEHARELISPETGYALLHKLCEQPIDYEVKMILNLNSYSRQQVCDGEYCLRLNQNGVDLNRNYDSHFKSYVDQNMQTSSGAESFSEAETRVVRDVLKEMNPDVFISVHSGALGLYTPFAYSDKEPENYKQMMKILIQIQDQHCPSCDVGVAGRMAGYLASGSALDYAYEELKIPYAFLFEIYHENMNVQKELKHKHAHDSFLQEDMTKDQCFAYFNPTSKEDYEWYTNNWSDALIKTLQLVNEPTLSHN